MKFEKLNLDAFSNAKLTDNSLRSINGGWLFTLKGYYGDDNGEHDIIFSDSETYYSDLGHTVCDDM